MNVKNKKVIAIDAKEIAKKKIESLGLILLELIPRLVEYDLLLMSDVEIPSQFVPSNAKTVIRGIPYTGGRDLFKYQYWVKKQCERYKVDWFIQINHFSLFRISSVKQIVIVHDLYPLEGLEKKSVISKALYWTSLFLTMINADTIFTVSEFSKKRLEHFFWESRKVQVNYNGIASIQNNIEKSGIVDGKFFLMLGRVSYWKGTIRVAEFFEEYFKDSEYKLIIAGQAKDENDSRAMREICDRAANIIWMDYVDNDTRDWLLQNTTLFLYASKYDGFGLPPLEAAKVKTKVLMNDIPVLREVTHNCGNYVNYYGDDNALYKSICVAAESNDQGYLERMYRVSASYTWDTYVDRIKDTIEKG